MSIQTTDILSPRDSLLSGILPVQWGKISEKNMDLIADVMYDLCEDESVQQSLLSKVESVYESLLKISPKRAHEMCCVLLANAAKFDRFDVVKFTAKVVENNHDLDAGMEASTSKKSVRIIYKRAKKLNRPAIQIAKTNIDPETLTRLGITDPFDLESIERLVKMKSDIDECLSLINKAIYPIDIAHRLSHAE
jgi:hypothetical protein